MATGDKFEYTPEGPSLGSVSVSADFSYHSLNYLTDQSIEGRRIASSICVAAAGDREARTPNPQP